MGQAPADAVAHAGPKLCISRFLATARSFRRRQGDAPNEELARRVTSSFFGVELRSGSVSVGGRVAKSFDLVSADHRIVGDAKCYTVTAGGNVPSAKWSVIAEYVWLLQQVDASRRFLVFGCDRAVPEGWLDRFQTLTDGVDFYLIVDQRLYDLKARARGE